MPARRILEEQDATCRHCLRSMRSCLAEDLAQRACGYFHQPCRRPEAGTTDRHASRFIRIAHPSSNCAEAGIADFSNVFLRSLDPEVLHRLRLRFTSYKLQQNLELPGKPVRSLVFLETGMASMTTAFLDGYEVGIGIFGRASIIGAPGLMGCRHSLHRTSMQIAGSGYTCGMAEASTEFRLAGPFQTSVLRYVQAQLLQSMQSIACNAKHTVEQRLARGLLLCADQTGCTRFRLPHASLADMLGTRRTTITMAALSLKRAGLLRYSRGTLEIPDRKALEARSCECYHTVRDYLANTTDFASLAA